MKKTLIINGHPNPHSLCSSISKSYEDGAKSRNHSIKTIHLNQLVFNPILQHGYQQRTELEPDLLSAWEDIKGADHIVWVYPNWWGTYPALLKGFIDRLFLPGFAFTPKENSSLWEKNLKGKTAHLMVTMDSPGWYYNLILGAAGHKTFKNSILNFVGIKTKKISNFRTVKGSTDTQREKWLKQAFEMGSRLS
jgi:putative NADPH-quinone reductase